MVQQGETKAPGFIFLKSNKKVHKVDLNSIVYIEAVGDYIKVVTDTSTILVNETMKNILEELPRGQFRRVHKSFIITGSRIKYFEGNFVQVGNTSIPIGATYREAIFSEFEKKNKR